MRKEHATARKHASQVAELEEKISALKFKYKETEESRRTREGEVSAIRLEGEAMRAEVGICASVCA